VVKATVNALKQLRSAEEIMARRGLSAGEQQ
jgi:ribosomal protein S5